MPAGLRARCLPLVPQTTLNQSIRATGVGLHSGDDVVLTLQPAPADTGIVFIRTDLAEKPHIKAAPDHVVDTQLATTIGDGQARIATIEHLMAALSSLGVDNVVVGVDAPELPIMDGSSAPFNYLIRAAGIQTLAAPRRYIRMLETVTVREGDIEASLSPYDGFRVSYKLHYEHPVFEEHNRRLSVDLTAERFESDIGQARTFGFLAEIEMLKSMDLARGGSLENAVVVDDSRILNDEGLRVQDEFVKHKILDAIGDLYTLGHPIIGAFSGIKSGHSTNNRLVRKLLASPHAFEIVTDWASVDEPRELRV